MEPKSQKEKSESTKRQEATAKKQSFESLYEYNKHLAEERGFKSIYEYRNYLARKRGIKSHSMYIIYLINKRGFKSIYKYKKYLAKKMGFKSVHECKEHMYKEHQKRYENKTLSKIIKDGLNELDKNQSWLAEKISITRQSVSLYVKRSMIPNEKFSTY